MSTRLRAAGVAATHLSEQQLSRLHRLLLDEQVAQQSRLAELEDAADLEPDLAEVLLGRCREGLEGIEEALARLDEKAYGRCVSCGAGIPYERLEAVPAARQCVSCPVGR